MSCLGEEELAAWASGRVEPSTAQHTREHLEECSDCRLLCDLVERGRPAFSQRVSLKPGERLGPYTLLEWVGQGGMGEVFAAWDARLDRRVALKVLSSARVSALVHEARAMAQLCHPNVATVFDVGEERGVPYLAMEFLPGGNLRAWLDAPRTLEQTLRVFIDVARGLCHAHARGVVHRDFKPANVVFDAAGVARVTDFGLAECGTLEASGQVVGTRGYVAPEVARGEPATHAADQYAFGVALGQALAVSRGRPSPQLTSALARMTGASPAERYRSMEEAVAVLSACQPSTRRRQLRARVTLVLATTLAVATAAAAVARGGRCDEAGAPARALAAQAGRRVPLAGPVLAELTRQLADWEQLSGELCAAAVPLDPRAACTAVGLDAVSTYVAWLESAPPSQPAAAWDRLMELPPSDTCRLLRHADAPAWTPHAAARQRALLQQLIGRVGGESPELLETDTLPRALALSAAVLAAPCADEALLQEAVSAARRAHHPVELKLWGQLAACQSARGGLKEAAFSLGMGEEVASAQAEGAPVRLSFDLQRVRVLHQGGRLDEAEALAARTLEVTAREVGQGHWLHAAALSRQAEVWMMRGRFAEVAALYRAALPVLERAFGPEDKRVLSAHHNLGSALAADHRYDEALREYAPLLLREGGWKNSPLTSDLVPVMLALGRSAEALKLGRAAIFDISERDPAVFSRRTQQLSAWAQAELAAGDPREVLRRMTVTLELEPLSAAPFESASLFRIFQAGALRRLGRAAEALALLDTVRATLRPVQKLLPTEQLLSAERARCLLELGKAQEARAELTRLDLDSRGGLDPLERARIWQQVARSLEASGRGPEALALASKAQQALAALAPRAQ